MSGILVRFPLLIFYRLVNLSYLQNFTEEDKEKIGIGKRRKSDNNMSQSTATINDEVKNGIMTNGKTLRDLWVDFLLEETTTGESK